MQLSDLDKWFPPCGPCAFCGHPDKRHRLWDMLIDSPDPPEMLANMYDLSLEAVQAVQQIRPYKEMGDSTGPAKTEERNT